MTSPRALAVLILLNAVLLAALSLTLTQPALAQDAQAQARYVMIAGEVSRGGPPAAIYIINTHTSDILVARYDGRTDELHLLDGRNVMADLEQFIDAQPQP